MIYNSFQDIRLSALGFGAMRLPVLSGPTVPEWYVIEGNSFFCYIIILREKHGAARRRFYLDLRTELQ